MNLQIHSLNTRLINSLEKENISLGLADGRMGFCIYFYYLSSVYTNTNYKKIAGELLDDIFENIDTISSIDVKNGLAGIGLGVDYLIKNNYVKGNVNVILNDIDDVIFKNLSCSKYIEKIDTLSLMHILYYLCVRLKSQKVGDENEYLFRELIIQTVNNLYEHIDLSFYEEPFAYNIDYPLPQFLFVLSEVYTFNFYNYRLIKIIEELSYKVLPILPLLHCNRLYLLWGMNALNKKIKNKNWEQHIRLICRQIDMNTILFQELKDKDIFFSNGAVSIYLMLSNLTEMLHGTTNSKNKILTRIKESRMWDLSISESQYLDKYKGMYNGYYGTILFGELVKNNQI